ncbi:formate dehydrogenase accessory sulfurtransferase FdhD [uncultured Pseudodesulfovibrio sp.]|uniref:formate dehydrogenase accessory sulfurtransferase FdhD n=1 Tax=uncultured Pseudodesulfovibrio sp. TaxID=2035858 RepID=UPI0029C80176|nr:formate dehydrogenase accessory sulfurtransferase FdhD [uncultured Pseudodesulfovibrio sp.]
MPHVKLYALKNEAEVWGREKAESAQTVQLACPVTLQQFADGKLSFREGLVAVESDIRVVVNGQDFGLLTRTPGDDLSLVVGHLFTCSMIRASEDVVDCSFHYKSSSRAEVTLKASDGIHRLYPSPRPAHIAPDRLFDFKQTFERRQNLYKNTHSTHAAALFSIDGEMIAFGEDVGRHNAFDKAIGRALLEGTLGRVNIAMLSSRLALELVIKAATANIPILCGFSAATSSAVNYAERNNITLAGRIRKDTFDIYSNGWRFQ